MSYTPIEILEYVIENEREADFLVANTMHKMNYSINEIADAKFIWKEDRLRVFSKAYNINEHIEDMDIMIASKAEKYISTFISRFNDSYQVHFLIHNCLTVDKELYEDEIAMRVIQYMILKTIKQLRLDTPAKVEEYLKIK